MTHLVWDWNGTLLDDLALTIAATNASLAAVGGTAVTVEQHRAAFRRPLTDYYAEMLGRHVTAYEFAYLDSVFQGVYQSGVADCDLAVDALPAIRAWSGAGGGLGGYGTQSLLSMYAHSDLIDQLRRRGLIGWLLRADGRRDEHFVEHKADYLAQHLLDLDLDGKECVIIGDSVDDADAAASVGAACVLYDGGVTDELVLRATGYPVASTLLEAITIAGRSAPPAPGDAEFRPEEDRVS
jgi:phosphoglycolate phosphatase-like HAD superfamily hydrolase